MDLAEHNGVSALGLREITRQVGVTPNAALHVVSNLPVLPEHRFIADLWNRVSKWTALSRR